VAWSLADAVTWPIDDAAIRLRISDKLAARLPALTRHVSRRLVGQPAGARQRRWLLTRLVAAGYAAQDRADWAYIERFFAPDVVARFGEGIPFDVERLTTGWEGWRASLERIFDTSLFQSRPHTVVDFGGQLFGACVEMRMMGQASGIAATEDLFSIYESRDGVVVRQWVTSSADELDGWLAERRAELGLSATDGR
jgi:hypothetical protein